MSRNWTTSELAAALHRQGVDMPNAIRTACGGGTPKRSKYNVGQDAESRAKRTVDGILFASEREARHYQSLKIAQDVGAISDLKLQPVFLLQSRLKLPSGKMQRAITYIADFEFLRCLPDHMSDERVVVDVKGVKTKEFRIKEKLFRAKYPNIKLELWA